MKISMMDIGGIMKINASHLKEWFIKYVPLGALVIDLVVMAFLCTLVLAYVPTQNGDNVEHIHSSFMIALGQVPYRDFFQHHNPLMWYIFAPLTKLFAYNATISEVVSLISFLVFLKSLVYVYRISAEFLSDKFWGVAAAAAIAAPSLKLYAIDFRPDNYMIFCLMGGIYYLFLYLRDKKTFQLSVAFLWFFLSFLFAQKAIFPLAVLGLCVLYFWKTNEISTPDMLKAMIAPFVGSCGFLYYLYHYDMVELYYLSNYTFNLNLAEGFENTRIAVMPLIMVIWIGLGCVGSLWGIFAGSKFLRVLVILFVSELLQRKLYFSPYSYYYWPLIYFAVLCGMPVLCKLDEKNRCVRFLFVCMLYYFLYLAGMHHLRQIERGKDKPYLPDFISRQISPCDYVFNGDGMMYNMFGKDPAYYWQLIGQLDVIGEQTGIRPRPNINQLIEELKPKFVFGKSYFNKFAYESGHPQVVHYVDKDLLNHYYDQTEFKVIYKLKPEYSRRKCVKDEQTGEWQFVE